MQIQYANTLRQFLCICKGIDQPDIVKQAAAADNEAKKVSQAVKQAPATIKKHTPFGCCVVL